MATSTRDPIHVYATVVYWQPVELPLLERCVESLLAQDTGPSIELRIIVIDNGCGLTPNLPASDRIESLRLPWNVGFSGGHNAGMRHALAYGADFVFLVNSDVVADLACVRELVDTALACPSVGLLGPLVLRERVPHRVESAGQAFNRLTGRHREVGRGCLATVIGRQPRAVDAVSGCAVLVSRSVLESVGLLDEALFAYFEDMDWCLRAGEAGYKVIVAPAARVWHRGGGSTGSAWPGTTYYSVRNHLVVATRHGRRATVWALPALVVAYHLAFLMRRRELRTASHLRALAQGSFAAWRARFGSQAKLADSD